MNLLYKEEFNTTWSESCKEYYDILNSLKNITSQVKVAYRFFDPNNYNKDQELIIDTDYVETSLIAYFGQIK